MKNAPVRHGGWGKTIELGKDIHLCAWCGTRFKVVGEDSRCPSCKMRAGAPAMPMTVYRVDPAVVAREAETRSHEATERNTERTEEKVEIRAEAMVGTNGETEERTAANRTVSGTDGESARHGLTVEQKRTVRAGIESGQTIGRIASDLKVSRGRIDAWLRVAGNEELLARTKENTLRLLRTPFKDRRAGNLPDPSAQAGTRKGKRDDVQADSPHPKSPEETEGTAVKVDIIPVLNEAMVTGALDRVLNEFVPLAMGILRPGPRPLLQVWQDDLAGLSTEEFTRVWGAMGVIIRNRAKKEAGVEAQTQRTRDGRES